MKQTPEYDRVQARMQPGEITLHGFLGADRRKLADIIADDEEVVHAHGVTHEQIAMRLSDLAQRGQDIAEREITLDDRYVVHVRDDRGVLPSPWGDGRFCKGEITMHDKQTNADFRWNELTAHMIRDYGFYGGAGSEYRIEPAQIIAALDLSRPEEGPVQIEGLDL